MRNAAIIALVVFAAYGLVSSPAAMADSPQEKYEKYMGKYYEHMEEAHEEAAEGDWDDYYEELEKAERDYAKAQSYLYQIQYRPYGGHGGYTYYNYRPYYVPQRPRSGLSFNFGFGYSHGDGCRCGCRNGYPHQYRRVPYDGFFHPRYRR